MALNLSTLTSPATSGDVLAESLTTADFLEPVPVLRNLARGSQKGGDAKQDVALNQPKALPLIDGDGYLYCPKVVGNYASIPLSSITTPASGPLDVRLKIKHRPTPVDGTLLDFAQNGSATGYNIQLLNNGTRIRIGTSTWGVTFSGVMPVITQTFWVRSTSTGSGGTVEGFYSLDGENWTSVGTGTDGGRGAETANELRIGQNLSSNVWGGAIIKAELYNSNNGTNKVLDVDFTSTNVRHGATKFKCATGQVVTINQSGNDPATIIKRSVLRFDGENDGLNGLFNQTIYSGYMFAAFSVLGDGGEPSARIFSANSTGGFDYQTGGFTLRRYNVTDQIQVRWNGGSEITHSDVFNGERGDFLLESPLGAGNQNSKINNADADDGTCGLPNPVSSEEFGIGSNTAGDGNACIDLEYLALFPADSVPDEATASRIRNYINNRNTVYLRHDTDGYYFFDPLSLTADAPVASWNGQIVGSDNDANLTITQSTANSQPDRLAPDKDGMVVRFNDNNDHLIVPAGFVEPADGSWQVVGTSLGTFAYRVNNTAVTELNLLGNLGNASYRKAGDLYGIILLPETATSADIESARKLLIDRGASDGASAGSLFAAWYSRGDIVNFKHLNTNSVTAAHYAWFSCSNLKEFPALDLSNSNRFEYAWQGTTALQSFPAGAKLGTAATNVNFNSAWRSSGLTSFSTPLPTARLGEQTWQESAVTSFSAPLPVVQRLYLAWHLCSSLTDFSADVFANWNPPNILNQVFDGAWDGCTSLTAQSVENILTSIDASGQYATSTGASGGTALGDAGIDIDYNVATGSLSAATTAAITSLKAKGWSIFINSVEQ